jgi:hypothetical protein
MKILNSNKKKPETDNSSNRETKSSTEPEKMSLCSKELRRLSRIELPDSKLKSKDSKVNVFQEVAAPTTKMETTKVDKYKEDFFNNLINGILVIGSEATAIPITRKTLVMLETHNNALRWSEITAQTQQLPIFH